MGKDHELLEAARTGDHKSVEKLLFPKSKSTAFAATLGIKLGRNVNCQDHSGYTPLHHAALNGHSDIVSILLKVGANSNLTDSKGSCPLHLASWNGHSEIVHMLISNGPSFASVNELNGDNESSLHCASQHGHKEVVQILLENHADPTFRNNRDESALDLASQYGRLDVVRLLLTYDPKLLLRSSERFTPLHLASRNGHREIVELLLVHGADINKVGANGTALHEAAFFGKSEVVSLLLKRGANPTAKDAKGRTALELVSQLDTSFSRTIANLIQARLQEGDDYETLSPIEKEQRLKVMGSLTSQNSRVFVDTKRVIAPGPRVTSKSFEEKADEKFNNLNSSLASEHSKTGVRKVKAGILRRTSSARSSRSLPRLSPSSNHHSKSFRFHRHHHVPLKTTEAKIPQHHPSIDMFPVDVQSTPKRSKKRSTSLPNSPSTQKALLNQPQSPHEDDVFFSFTSSPNRTLRESVITVGYGDDFSRHPVPSFSTFTPRTPVSAKASPSKKSSCKNDDSLLLNNTAEEHTRNFRSNSLSISYNKESKHDIPVILPPLNNTFDGVYENLNSDIPPPLPRKSISLSPKLENKKIEERLSPPLPIKEKDKLTFMVTNNSRVDITVASKPTAKTKKNENKVINAKLEANKTVKETLEASENKSSIIGDGSSTRSTVKPVSPPAPTKPTRASRIGPPPLPPKPNHMQESIKIKNLKIRPPSPIAPPPDDISDISSQCSSSNRSSLSNHSPNPVEIAKGVMPVPKPRHKITRHSPTESKSPPFSPPSPNTAMLQVSSAIQRVLTVDDGQPDATYENVHHLSPQPPLSTSLSTNNDNCDQQNISNNAPLFINNVSATKTNNQHCENIPKSKTTTATFKTSPKPNPRKHCVKTTTDNITYEATRLVPADSTLKLQLYDIPFIDDGSELPKNVRRSLIGNVSEDFSANKENIIILHSEEGTKRRKRSSNSENLSNINDSTLDKKFSENSKAPIKTMALYTPSEVKRARICSTKSVSEHTFSSNLSVEKQNSNMSRKSRSESDLNHKKSIENLFKCKDVTIHKSMHSNLSANISEPFDSVQNLSNVSTQESNTNLNSNVVTTQSQAIVMAAVIQSVDKNTKSKVPAKIQKPKVPPKHLKPKLIKTIEDSPDSKNNKVKIEHVNIPHNELNNSIEKTATEKQSLDGSLKQRRKYLLEKDLSCSTTSLDTSDDWNDNVSDRTDDIDIPKHARRYRD